MPDKKGRKLVIKPVKGLPIPPSNTYSQNLSALERFERKRGGGSSCKQIKLRR